MGKDNSTPALTFGQQCAEVCRVAAGEHRRQSKSLTWDEVAIIIDAADLARPAKKRLTNGRDLLFDAIARATGTNPDKPIPRGMAATIATAKRDILEIDARTTPEAITSRAETLRTTLPRGSTWGPLALAKYWQTLEPKHIDAPKLPQGPKGWLATLNRIHPESMVARGGIFEIEKETDYAWTHLDSTVRHDIQKAMP